MVIIPSAAGNVHPALWRAPVWFCRKGRLKAAGAALGTGWTLDQCCTERVAAQSTAGLAGSVPFALRLLAQLKSFSRTFFLLVA